MPISEGKTDLHLSPEYYLEVKHKLPRPGIELESPILFPTTINVMLSESLKRKKKQNAETGCSREDLTGAMDWGGGRVWKRVRDFHAVSTTFISYDYNCYAKRVSQKEKKIQNAETGCRREDLTGAMDFGGIDGEKESENLMLSAHLDDDNDKDDDNEDDDDDYYDDDEEEEEKENDYIADHREIL